MKKTLTIIPALFALMPLMNAAVTMNGDVTVFSAISSAPNSSSASSAYPGYLDSLRLAASDSGFSAVGNRNTDASAFEPIATPTVDLAEAFVTDYASWRGVAAPGAPFANEYGNRLQFDVIAIATGPGISLSLSGVTFGITSTAMPDIGNTYASIGSYSASTYSTRNIGVTSFGADGKLGGGDDSYLMGGEAGTTAVLALILRGNGFAFDGTTRFDGSAWAPSVADSAKYAQFRADYANAFTHGVDLTASYTLNYTGGAGSVTATGDTITVVPEPSAYALGASSVAALATLLRRRRKK